MQRSAISMAISMADDDDSRMSHPEVHQLDTHGRAVSYDE